MLAHSLINCGLLNYYYLLTLRLCLIDDLIRSFFLFLLAKQVVTPIYVCHFVILRLFFAIIIISIVAIAADLEWLDRTDQ